MVKVNLLPTEPSGVRKTPSPRFNLNKVSIFLFSLSFIFLLAGIYLRIGTMYRKKNLYQITQEYKNTLDLTKKTEALKQEQNRLIGEINILNSYLKRDILWSEKLIQLRNLIPREVWLKQLSFEKKSVGSTYLSSLFLKGSLMPQDKSSPVGTLSMFVNKLKEDEAFFADFENLTLSDFRMETYKNIETMAFFIEMPFKKR